MPQNAPLFMTPSAQPQDVSKTLSTPTAVTTVLFDLDGTLLPMDQDLFVKTYFKMISGVLAPFGYTAPAVSAALWKGTAAMVKNDGSRTNDAAFWQVFGAELGEEVLTHRGVIDKFYRKDFPAIAKVLGFDERAPRAVRRLREKGIPSVLATSPIFPALATYARVRMAGLTPEEFLLITTCENSTHCKPNPDYYRDILGQLHLNPEECLMVGNDATEDVAAMEAGIPVFLLTDCLINREGKNLDAYPHGNFDDLLTLIEGLPDIPAGRK